VTEEQPLLQRHRRQWQMPAADNDTEAHSALRYRLRFHRQVLLPEVADDVEWHLLPAGQHTQQDRMCADHQNPDRKVMLPKRTNSVGERRMLPGGESIVARRVLLVCHHVEKSFDMPDRDTGEAGSGLQRGLRQDARRIMLSQSRYPRHTRAANCAALSSRP